MVGFFIGAGIGLVAIIGLGIFYYNRLVTLSHRIDNAWSQIDVQLARRASLIPSLVKLIDAPRAGSSTVITRAEDIYREVYESNEGESPLDAQERLNTSIKELVTLAKSNKKGSGLKQIVEEVRDTEDKISYMRQSFNDTVTRYNEALVHFPTNVIAGIFGFAPRPALQIDPSLKNL